MTEHPYQSANPVHSLRQELAILAVVVVLATYWIVMLVLGIGNTRDPIVDVRGVQITTPSTTPPVTYQPVPAP